MLGGAPQRQRHAVMTQSPAANEGWAHRTLSKVRGVLGVLSDLATLAPALFIAVSLLVGLATGQPWLVLVALCAMSLLLNAWQWTKLSSIRGGPPRPVPTTRSAPSPWLPDPVDLNTLVLMKEDLEDALQSAESKGRAHLEAACTAAFDFLVIRIGPPGYFSVLIVFTVHCESVRQQAEVAVYDSPTNVHLVSIGKPWRPAPSVRLRAPWRSDDNWARLIKLSWARERAHSMVGDLALYYDGDPPEWRAQYQPLVDGEPARLRAYHLHSGSLVTAEVSAPRTDPRGPSDGRPLA